MRLLVFSVFDTKVGAYAAPFMVRTKGEAIRSFTDACGDDKLPFKAHPGDYRLFWLGEFDDGTGVYNPDGPIVPQYVIGADEIISPALSSVDPLKTDGARGARPVVM